MAKRSSAKESRGGRKTALRRHKPTGTALEEVVTAQRTVEVGPHDRVLSVPMLRDGSPVSDTAGGAGSLEQSRERLRQALVSVPWEGLKLSRGEPAIPTAYI